MAWMNRKLDINLETVFMMSAGAYSYLSSRLVREIASLGGALEGLIPASEESRLRERLGVTPLAPR
jgi:pantetheine-phosphate adenylyltransferase